MVSLVLAGLLIDGTGAAPRPHAVLLVADGRVTAVLDQADLTPTMRRGAAVLDASDGAVLPGLIDSHVHLTFNAARTHDEVRAALEEETDAELTARALRNARAHLAGGVTTVRDVGGRGLVTLAVRDRLRAAGMGPRVWAAGPALTTPRGHLHYLGCTATGAAALRARSEEVLAAGADLVKVCATGGLMTAESDPLGSQYDEAALAGAVAAARAAGTYVAAHVLAAEALGRCVRAGVRTIEHCMWQTAPGEYAFEPATAAAMRAGGQFAGFTFAGLGQARYREEVLGRPANEALGPWRERMQRRYAAERATIDAGVPYALHSDCGVRDTPFGEFWLVPAAAAFELGLTPLEALHAVTGGAAALMGLSEEVGTLTPGRRADLLVTDGNPATDLRVLAAPRQVVLGGRPVPGGDRDP